MPKVIYCSFQPYAFEYAKILHEELQWEPVYWVVSGESETQVKNTFPNALTHNMYDAIKGKFPEKYTNDRLLAVDPELLNAMAPHESIALNMMNRNYLDHPFAYQDRLRHYHRMLRFYYTLMHDLKPDYVVLEDTPHQAFDYILYVLAHQMGIKTILFECSWFPDYFFPMEKFEEGNLPFIEAYQKACIDAKRHKTESSPYVAAALNKLKGSFNKGMQDHMVEKVASFQKLSSNRHIKRVQHSLSLLVKLFNISKFTKRFKAVMALGEPALHNYYKRDGMNIEDSVLSNLDYIKAIRRLKKIKTANLQYYQSIQVNKPDLDVPFIFCALHFQPEKSTSPWGGQFVNQFLVIDMLSKSVPKGWKIYVKDHIAQYTYPETGEPFRNKSFYDDIKSLGNVELIPMHYTPFELIDKARAVASVAGSVLQEAIVRGKPALAFGAGHHCWCGGCEGIFYTPDKPSLEKALHSISNRYKVDADKVELYFQMVEKQGYRGYVGGSSQAQRSGMTPAENGRSHANAIKDLVSKTNSKQALH